MPIPQTVKDNPVKILIGMSGSIIAIVGALFAVDARYAHATDVAKEKTEIQQQVIDSSQVLRKQMIEDKLFELDFKKAQTQDQRLSPLDSALRERYQRQLNEITRSQPKQSSIQ